MWIRLLPVAMLVASTACKPDDFDGDGVPDEEDCNPVPNGAEVCDGIDNDCNGEVDDAASDFITFYKDADGDRHGLEADSTQACEAPAGYVLVAGDCDDNDADVNESMTEVCNDKDDNCDDQVDEGAAAKTTYYRDADGDRWGDPAQKRDACTQPSGYVDVADDCDDSNLESHPGAAEVCDGDDNDCDDQTDEDAADMRPWWTDADGDGFGAGDSTRSCEAPDGFVEVDGDCDDRVKATYPGAREVCDLKDNSCNGQVDENATDAKTYYRDADGDSFGSIDWTTKACGAPTGYVEDSTDCDDVDGGSYPGAIEYCDEADNDCDLSTDEEAADVETFYRDSDGDGAGDAKVSVTACDPPAGYVDNKLDCDDKDKAVIHCVWTGTRTFRNCSATGQNGPTQTACNTAYTGTTLAGEVTVTGGKQSWTVPADGTYRIEASGAQGKSTDSARTGGLGARMRGDFTLKKGDVLVIVVGQEGITDSCNGGGGGGSFVVTSGGTAMLVAGGGSGTRTGASSNGCSAGTSNYAGSGSGSSSSSSCPLKTTGLTSGGIVSSSSWGSAGAGFSSNGAGEYDSNNGGKSWASGSTGGGTSSYPAYGGFGGGGAGNGGCGGGGGGGYSGGDGGWIAGAGGSYNTGASQSNSAGVQTSHGRVTIDKI
jgi:hypothetical protein